VRIAPLQRGLEVAGCNAQGGSRSIALLLGRYKQPCSRYCVKLQIIDGDVDILYTSISTRALVPMTGSLTTAFPAVLVQQPLQTSVSPWSGSAATATSIPFNLVPMGSPALLIRTQALSSKRTKLPSGRPYFFFVRTTTAWEMSPRRTFCAAAALPESSDPRGLCFCTTTTIRSPAEQDLAISHRKNSEHMRPRFTHRLWRRASS
jgi:hypothetical protein